MENETITLDEDQIIDGIEEEADESELLHTQLPLSKIKKMAKLVPSLHMITAEGVKAITFASEVYVELLAKAAYQSAQEDGRKTVQMKDISRPLKIEMAVKTIRIPQKRYEKQEADEKLTRLKREINNFRQLSHHPNIVDCYGLCYNDGEAMICMELMDMSLYDLYSTVHDKKVGHDKKEIFPEAILGYIAVQVLEALGFCKQNNFIHRDVKPKNILLNKKGEVKLCDFGESRVLKDSLASTFVGTVAYWPPERFKANEKLEVVSLDEAKVPYDVRSDIWSLGITLTETVYGKLPFLDEKGKTFDTANNVNMISPNIVAVQNAIKIADPDKIIERCFGNAYSSECTKFIRSCLEKVEKRPKYAALMEEPFYYKSKKSVGQEEFKEFIRVYEEAAGMQDA